MIDRRTTIKWMLTAVATVPLLRRQALGQVAAVKGYGTDPDLIKEYQPGSLWPLTFTQGQRRTATVLCDLIIPADAHSPSASDVGVVDFLDEWISAPYTGQQQDRAIVLTGLEWLDKEAVRRFGIGFSDLRSPRHHAICDDICFVAEAKPHFSEAAAFFARYRDLTAGGFYTTPAGRNDLQYVGNVPLATFDGPPLEVLKKVGLA